MNKTVKIKWEKERETIYRGGLRARSLKRSTVRLSEHQGNHPLSVEELPRVPYLLKMDDLRSSQL